MKKNNNVVCGERDDHHLEFPKWASMKQRDFLLHDGSSTSVSSSSDNDDHYFSSGDDESAIMPPPVNANVTVVKDGSGQVTTIREALNFVPNNNNMAPFIIYVKAGVYEEQVMVNDAQLNVYIIGDGMFMTIITDNKSVNGDPKINTKSTATFSVFGRGFVAKDVTFQNTAGLAKFQAVALFCGADSSIFYRRRFNAYQDTLYAGRNRQFYRECDIIGTVDFIFGNAAVVFQRCNILPREPLPFQKNTITAQGKLTPDDDDVLASGISIHECSIRAYGTVTRPTYLGRPWKSYSTTIVMRTEMSDVIKSILWF